MRYAQYIVMGALIWAVAACSSKPSEEFIKKVNDEYQKVSAIDTRLKELEDQVAALKDPFAALKNELGNVWTDKVEKDKDLSAKISEITKKAQDLENSFNTAKNDITSALSEAKAFVDGLADQQKGDEELQKDWDSVKNKVTEKQGALDQVANSAKALQDEVNALTEEIKKKYAPKK